MKDDESIFSHPKESAMALNVLAQGIKRIANWDQDTANGLATIMEEVSASVIFSTENNQANKNSNLVKQRKFIDRESEEIESTK